MLKTQVIGRCGKDAAINQAGSKQVINFTVAHSEKYKNGKGEQVDKTTWIECAYFTDKTGIAPYIKKGGQIFVEGTPEARTYPKNDGTTGVSLTLRVSHIELLGGGKEAATQPPAATVNTNNSVSDDPDGLPF